MRYFLYPCFALCFLYQPASQAANSSEYRFAQTEDKQSITLLDHLGVAIGPFALSGDVLYFSERVFDSPICLGQGLFFARLSKPKQAPQKLAEIPCVVDMSAAPKESVAIRYWEEVGKVVLWEGTQAAGKLAPFRPATAVNGPLRSDFWLTFFDLHPDLLDGTILDHFPSNLASRGVAWVASENGKQLAVGAYTMGGEKIVTALAPSATGTERFRSVLSFGDDSLYFPSESARVNRITLTAANSTATQWGRVDPAVFPVGAKVPEAEWGVREITQMKASVMGDAVWILMNSKRLGEPNAFWFYDPREKNFLNVPGIPAADASSFYPSVDGVMVGTLSGRIVWFRSPQGQKGNEPAAAAGKCRYRFTSVQTERGKETLISYQAEVGFSPILFTQPIQPGAWLCNGEHLALLSNGFRFLWADGQVTFAVQESRRNESVGTSLSAVLKWQEEAKTASFSLADQSLLPSDASNPTLLLFSGRALKMARTGFGGHSFQSLKAGGEETFSIELDPPSLPITVRLGWDGLGFQGVPK